MRLEGPEIGQLTSLTQLCLSCNELASLPPEIRQLRALMQLYLTANKLTSLPPEMKNLTVLTELFLHENPSLDLPAEVLGPGHRALQEKAAAPVSPQVILEYWFSTHGA